MAASASGPKAAGRARAPDVNLFDLPELMPGAQPSATPAQREEFEQRCRQLHRDEVSERAETMDALRAGSGARATTSDLEAMFPALDPALVRTLAAESPSPQHAIETLLALSAAVAEPVIGSEGAASTQRATSPPPRNLGVEDYNLFPSLVDADGWQVPSRKLLEKSGDEDEEDLGSAWCERAKAAKDMPAPKAAPATVAASAASRRQGRPKDEGGDRAPEFLTDYEFRQRVGQRRAQRRAQYGRGARTGGRGRGASVEQAGGGFVGDGSDSEASEATLGTAASLLPQEEPAEWADGRR